MSRLTESLISFFKRDDLKEETTESPFTIEYDEMEGLDNFYGYNLRQSTSSKEVRKNKKKVADVETKNNMILACRRISAMPEVSEVVDDVVNSILHVKDYNNKSYKLDFDTESKLDDTSKKKIVESFNKVLNKLNFKQSPTSSV